MAVGLSNFDKTEEYQLSMKLKSELENKYSETVDSINEQELPQISKTDLTLAIAGVPFAFILIVLSVIISAAIGIGLIWLIYNLEASLIHRVHGGIIAMIAIGIVIAFCVSLKSVVLAFLNRDIFEISAILPENDTQIRNDVAEVCSKLNISIPDNILLSFNPTFYVTESPIITLNGKYKGRTLVVGIAYIRYLNNNEFKSIISHEMGHFTGKDTIFSIYVSPLYKSIGRIVGTLNQYSGGESTGSIAMFLPMLPLIWILSIFYNWYAKLESKISRQREMRADYIATLLYGEQNFRSALTKVANYNTIFSNVYSKDYIAVLREDKMFKNYFSFFDSNLNKDKLNDESIINDSSDAYSSHCSTKDRFEYIPKINSNEECLTYDCEHYNKEEEYLTEAMGYHLTRIINIRASQQRVTENNQANN